MVLPIIWLGTLGVTSQGAMDHSTIEYTSGLPDSTSGAIF